MGRAGKTMPRCPLPTARCISATAASGGQMGTMHWGMNRGLAAAHSSSSQSL